MAETPKFPDPLGSPITRRQAIKAGGIAAIGLVFAEPLIQTLRPRSAFAAGTAAGSYRPAATGPGPTGPGGGPTGPTNTDGPTGPPSQSGPTAGGATATISSG